MAEPVTAAPNASRNPVVLGLSAEQLFQRGYAHQQAGRLTEAEADYRSAIAANPRHINALQLLGLLRYQLRDGIEARALYSQAIAAAPNIPELHLNYANILKDLGELRLAFDHYVAALKLRPNFAEAHFNLGDMYSDAGDFEPAIKYLRQSLELNNRFAPAWLRLGQIYMAQNRPDEALTAMRNGVALNPGNTDALLILGTALQTVKEYEEAIAVFEQAWALDASLAEAPYNIGNALVERGEAYEAQAEQKFRQALAIRDDYAKAWFNLAESLRRQDRLDEARPCYQRALILEPTLNPQARAVRDITAFVLSGVAQLHHPTSGWEELPEHLFLPGKISVIVCSITPARLAAVRANFEHLLAGEDWEFIHIGDARSLCEGYNRGVAQASGEILVFSHDDIEILSEDFRYKLRAYLAHQDIIGVAGTRRLCGKHWSAAGWPDTAGKITHPDPKGWRVNVYGVLHPLNPGMQALDGVFFAARRHVCRQVPFDAETFDGFHFYDLDFTFSAWKAGFKLAVAADINLIHHSEGRFDEVWAGYAARFQQKHGADLAAEPPATPIWPTALLQNRHDLHLFNELLVIDCVTHDPGYYNVWRSIFAAEDEVTLQRQRDEIAGWDQPPLISVVMPVYNTPLDLLAAAIASVRQQTYPHWQLCIADDASPDPTIQPFLRQAAASDPRIKVVFRPDNGHISAASNSALEVAEGTWLALLDHDDVITPDALYYMVKCIRRHPDAALLYSDEDKLLENGKLAYPYFKPDFNLDLFRAQNMITHLSLYRADVVRELGGFRLGFEGSQDYDLALRVLDHSGPQAIQHVPRVLYHWRLLAGSTAKAGTEKSYAFPAAVRALQEHLQRTGEEAEVVVAEDGYGMTRFRYALPYPPPMVSLIIPTRNGLDLLRRCLDTLFALTDYPRFEVLVIDNGSDDPATLAYLSDMRAARKIRLFRDERPFNFSALNNRGVQHAQGSVVGLLNNDLEIIHADWLTEMVSHALRPGVGAVGARLWYPNQTLQHGGVILVGGVAGHAHKGLPRKLGGNYSRAVLHQQFSAVTAACLIVQKAHYLAVGGLDETLEVAFNDIDFCLKLDAQGLRNVWTPYAELIHHESASRGYETTPEKRKRFDGEVAKMHQRWGARLKYDPAYNPNLSRDREDFTPAWPPKPAAW